MSNLKRTSLKNFLRTPGEEYTPNYKKWNNKEEWKLVGGIKDRIMQMYRARQAGCYLINYDGSRSWDPHWEQAEKIYLAGEQNDQKDYGSNLQSTIAYRTIAALDAKERRQEVEFMVEARNESDESKGRALTHKYIFKDYFRRNKGIRYKFLDVSKRTKIFGTSIAYIPYTVRVRDVEFPITPDITKEDIELGKLPEMKYEAKTIVDFEDIDFVPWDIRDFYIDPNATDLHGTTRAAVDAAGIMYVTPAQVKIMFQGDPDVVNLDKIDSSNFESFSSSIFKSPRDYEKGFGELIFYYNIETDSEVFIYNEMLIKNKPNPYQDKRIPFVAFHCVRHPGQFYGMGIVDLVIQQSAEESAIKNLQLDRNKIITAPPIIVGSGVFSEVADQIEKYEPNMLIKMSDPSQFRPVELPNIPFDSFRIMEGLKDEAVMNTGINPQGMMLPMASTPATNTLAMKETSSDMGNMYSDTLMEGMGYWGDLLESRVCQFYPLPTKKAALELNKKEMRELRLEDIDLFKDAGGNYKTREMKGAKIIRLDKDMFKWESTPNIYISPDFVSPISQAFKMRKAQEILPQLTPFAGDPGTPMANGSPAVIDIRKLTKWYLTEMDMSDEDLMLDEDEDRMDEIKQAVEQNKRMQEGEHVPGIPGEPKSHKYAHAVELLTINDNISSNEFMAMMNSGDPELMAIVQAMDSYRKALADHLRVDSLLDAQAADASMQESDAIDQAMNPTMPMNNQAQVPAVAGMDGMPNNSNVPVPNKMGVEDVTGQTMGTQF